MDEQIELTPKEFDILYLLASHPKKVYSVENIFQQVWGEAYLRRWKYGNGTYPYFAEKTWRR